MMASSSFSRGFVFSSVIFLTFLALLGVMILWSQRQMIVEEKTVVKLRAESLREFTRAVERDSSRMFFISGTRSLFYLTNYVISTKTPVSNSSIALVELMQNGTINGVSTYRAGNETVNVTALMENATLTYWLRKVREMSAFFDFDSNVTFDSFDVHMQDAWHVNVSAFLHLTLRDERGLVSYEKVFFVSTLLPIDYLEDPLYPLQTDGQVYRQYVRAQRPFVRELARGTGQGFAFARLSHVSSCADVATSPRDRILLATCDSLIMSCRPLFNEFFGVICTDTFALCGGPSGCDIRVPFVENASAASSLPNETWVLIHDGGIFNITNLIAATERGYVESNVSPDALSRLEGSFASSPFGVESLLGPWAGVEKTRVDHLYFSASNPPSFLIKGMYGCETNQTCALSMMYGQPIVHFRLDNETVLIDRTCEGIPSPGTVCRRLEYYDVSHLVFSP